MSCRLTGNSRCGPSREVITSAPPIVVRTPDLDSLVQTGTCPIRTAPAWFKTVCSI